MDVFKLGDEILALLEVVFGFWNNQISLVFAMLGQSPVNFKGGGPWAAIEAINPIFVAVGSSLVVLSTPWLMSCDCSCIADKIPQELASNMYSDLVYPILRMTSRAIS